MGNALTRQQSSFLGSRRRSGMLDESNSEAVKTYINVVLLCFILGALWQLLGAHSDPPAGLWFSQLLRSSWLCNLPYWATDAPYIRQINGEVTWQVCWTRLGLSLSPFCPGSTHTALLLQTVESLAACRPAGLPIETSNFLPPSAWWSDVNLIFRHIESWQRKGFVRGGTEVSSMTQGK